METFSIVFPQVVTRTSFDLLMGAKGAYVTSGVSKHHCLQRGDSAVYLNLEDESDQDVGVLERLRDQLPWSPRSMITVTVSRRQGSLVLAFEIAACLARRWDGTIDWAGLNQWEEWFHAWKKTNRGNEN